MSFDLELKNGDLVISKGDIQTVEDGEKLIQDILKILLTDAGTNPMFPWYGSYLTQTIVGSAQDQNMLLNIGKEQIKNALENLVLLQQEQRSKSGQIVTPDEHIAAIIDISINREPKNPSLYYVLVRAVSKGNKPINTSFKVSTI